MAAWAMRAARETGRHDGTWEEVSVAGSVAAQREAVLPQLFANFVKRGHAEVLRFEQVVGGALDELAEGRDAQAVHAFAGANAEVELGDRLVEDGLFLLGQ